MLDTNETAGTLAQLFDLYSRCEVVDLSATLENDIPRWPTHPPLVVHHTLSHAHDGYFSNTIFAPAHIRTHCDAPAHSHANLPEQTVDRLATEATMGLAVVIAQAPHDVQEGEMRGK